MAADLNDVDTTEARELGDNSPFPPGEYTAYIDESERKTTKAGDGEYLSTKWIINGGEHDGRVIFHNFNLWNKNDVAVNIAKSEWRAVCEVTTGKPGVSNSEEVHHKKCIITVGLETDQKGQPRNTIVFRKDKIRAIGTSSSKPATTATAAVAKPATKKTPW